MTRELVEHGLVSEGAAELSGTAGPANCSTSARGDGASPASNLTSDRLFAAVTDLEARVLVSHDEALDSEDVEGAIAQIGRVRERLVVGRPDIAAAGIALAGDLVTSTGRQIVTESPFLGWRRIPLAEPAEQRLGVPVATENDVRCLTAAEHWFGVGAGFDSMALITAAYAFGVLVATLANTFDPEKIVITGEGIPVADLARSELDSAIAATLHPTAAPWPSTSNRSSSPSGREPQPSSPSGTASGSGRPRTSPPAEPRNPARQLVPHSHI